MGRYSQSSQIPQPIRKINPASTDLLIPLSMGQRIDNLAQKYYGDVTLGWIIMCANPEFENELEIPFGYKVRIPFPLQRVYAAWRQESD